MRLFLIYYLCSEIPEAELAQHEAAFAAEGADLRPADAPMYLWTPHVPAEPSMSSLSLLRTAYSCDHIYTSIQRIWPET